MSVRALSIGRSIGLTVSLAWLTACSAHPHPSTASAACNGIDPGAEAARVYAEASAGSASPLRVREFQARAIQPQYIAGAQLDMPAPAGMSEEYVERVLACHAATGGPAAHPNDPLRAGAGPVAVSVSSAGPGYRVTLKAGDRAGGAAVWQRAQALTSGAGDVQVEQVAQAASTPEL